MDKKSLSERDIGTKFVVPALQSAGWDIQHQVREEHFFTAGQVLVKGKTVRRGKRKFADFLLSCKPNMPLALIEAKDNNHSIGSGMQQGLDYARTLDIPFVFSTNGDAFLFHNRLTTSGPIEQELPLDQFPSPSDLWLSGFTNAHLGAFWQALGVEDWRRFRMCLPCLGRKNASRRKPNGERRCGFNCHRTQLRVCKSAIVTTPNGPMAFCHTCCQTDGNGFGLASLVVFLAVAHRPKNAQSFGTAKFRGSVRRT